MRTTEKELQAIRPGCRGYVVDLAKADQTEAFVDAAVKDSGGFDILVSTVGVNCHCPAAEYKDEDMFRLLETNYLSGVRCARKVIPTMQARGGGSIINISSIHSLMSQPTNMLYAGTKGAMNAAARVMALDYAKDNIRVNTICPGVVISDVMYDDMDKLDDAGKSSWTLPCTAASLWSLAACRILPTQPCFCQQYERQHYRPDPAFRRRNKH